MMKITKWMQDLLDGVLLREHIPAQAKNNLDALYDMFHSKQRALENEINLDKIRYLAYLIASGKKVLIVTGDWWYYKTYVLPIIRTELDEGEVEYKEASGNIHFDKEIVLRVRSYTADEPVLMGYSYDHVCFMRMKYHRFRGMIELLYDYVSYVEVSVIAEMKDY